MPEVPEQHRVTPASRASERPASNPPSIPKPRSKSTPHSLGTSPSVWSSAGHTVQRLPDNPGNPHTQVRCESFLGAPQSQHCNTKEGSLPQTPLFLSPPSRLCPGTVLPTTGGGGHLSLWSCLCLPESPSQMKHSRTEPGTET